MLSNAIKNNVMLWNNGKPVVGSLCLLCLNVDGKAKARI